MAVVVGYVPTKRGPSGSAPGGGGVAAAPQRLIVINSSRGGKDFDAEEAVRYEAELHRSRDDLDAAGVDHEVRQLVRGHEPSEDLIAVAEEADAEFIVIGLRRRTPVAS